VSGHEAVKKLDLGDVCYVTPDQIPYLLTVRTLQRSEAAHVKGLEDVGGVRWHAQRNNVLLLAVLLELQGVVTLVAVDDEEPVRAHFAVPCVLIKVLDPI
jgi:hypothetical protein